MIWAVYYSEQRGTDIQNVFLVLTCLDVNSALTLCRLLCVKHEYYTFNANVIYELLLNMVDLSLKEPT